MEFAEYALLGTVIAGVTEMLNRIRAKDYWVAVTVATSAAIGALFGAFGVEELNLITGMAAGFGISGTMSVIGMVRGKSTPVESSATGSRNVAH